MTVKDLLNRIHYELMSRGVDNAHNEAYFIAQKALKMNRTELVLSSNTDVSDENTYTALGYLEKRLSGLPIQYCLGEWDFYGNTYKVGEGVLIPRPETEELCEIVLKELQNVSSPTVIDLCAGSGCIGLTIKSNKPDATVFLVEKSKQALGYLIENAATVCKSQFISIVNGDALKPDEFSETFDKVDAIISNPPYIKSEEIPFLQSEVQLEPKIALDGGKDGYDFYRVICSQWTAYLRNGGFIALECGENQAEYICGLFDKNIFETKIFKDFNGTDRFVLGRMKN